MTTNNISLISKLFVVGITYLSTRLIIKFNSLDLAYFLFIIGCFIRFLYIRKSQKSGEWQTFFFLL